MRLFVGDDWAEDHHDVELMDERGRVLARKRLPEGVAGMARLHELTGQQLGEGADDAEVIIGTGTDRDHITRLGSVQVQRHALPLPYREDAQKLVLPRRLG
jgi:hypothetical protein